MTALLPDECISKYPPGGKWSFGVDGVVGLGQDDAECDETGCFSNIDSRGNGNGHGGILYSIESVEETHEGGSLYVSKFE